MRKLAIICTVVVFVMTVPAGATLYSVVDDEVVHGSPGPLNLEQTTDLVTYIDGTDHRVFSVGFKLTNNSATTTYTDVKVVDPFEWLQMNLTPSYQVCGWVNAENQWINPDYNGNDGVQDGLFVKVYDGPDDPVISAMLMSNTDIPLTSPLSGTGDYEATASVLATDSVPCWDVAASLAPSQSISYTVYLDIERLSTPPYVLGKRSDMYVVAIPEPATICLLGLGGLALFRKRRA